MALVRWSDDERKKDEEFENPNIRTIQSVQSSWQPSSNNASVTGQSTSIFDNSNQPSTPQGSAGSYLLSDEKAQADAQRAAEREAERQRRAAEAAAAAAAAAAAQAAAEAQQRAAAAQAAQAQQQRPEPRRQQQAGRYANVVEETKEGGFRGLLKSFGASIQQAAGAVADTGLHALGTGDYLRRRAIGRSADDAARQSTERIGAMRNWLHDRRDITGQNMTGVRDVEQAAGNIANGRGNFRDYMEVAGKSLQVGLDSTMFINPARVGFNAARNTATSVRNAGFVQRALANPGVQFAARDAGFFGGLQGVATGMGEYGRTGDWGDAAKAAAADAAIGAAFQGTADLAAQGVGRTVRNFMPANAATNSLRGGGRAANQPQTPLQRLEEVSAEFDAQRPQNDGNVSFEPQATQSEQPLYVPAGREAEIRQMAREQAMRENQPYQQAEQSSQVLRAREEAAADVPREGIEQPADGIVQPEEVTPAQLEPETPQQPVEPAPEPEAPLTADVTPVRDPNMPTIRSEEIRNLQEARAGTTQAEEAAINQRLQEVQGSTPRKVYRGGDATGFDPTKVTDKGVSVATNRENAQWFGGGYDPDYAAKSGKSVQELELAADAKILDVNDVPPQLQEEFKRLNTDNTTLKEEAALPDIIRDPKAPAPKPEPKPVKPVATKPKSNLPDDMTPIKPSETPATPKKPKKAISPEKQARKDFANVFTRSTDSNSDMQGRLARSVNMAKDAESGVDEILSAGGVTGKQAERIQNLFNRAAEIAENNKATQKQYRKDFIKGGKEAIDDAPARQRNRETEEAAYLRNQLNSELKKLERKGDWGEKLTQGFENVISGKNSNQLIGAPIERGLTAEVIGNAMNTIKAPIKQIRGAFMHGMPGKSAVKRLVRDLKTPPKTATEGYKYLIGNIYRAAMAPAQALADSRKGALRTELTKYAYKNKIGKELSNKDAERVSRMAGNDMEALVNMGAGVDNGTINVLAYRRALRKWKQFIETGSEADYKAYMDTIDRQTSIVDKLAQGFSTQGKNRAQRAGLTLVNALLPYMRNAVNMSTKGVVLDINPFTLSLLDGIRKDQRGFMGNLALGLKNKTVDCAVLAALGSVLTYNDGTDPDTVDQPRGVSIHLGGNEYFSIRGTPLELPLGAIMVAKQLAQDGVEGNFKDVGYYGGMITPSIPYADYMTSHGNVIDSIEKWGTEEGDNGYAAKNFAVGNAKSLTPFSNNNIEASLSRFGSDESLTAKSVYASKEVPDGEGGTKKVADMGQWYLNSLANNNLGKVLPFVPDRSELKDSRDAAGRVRTVDNQGSWMRKKINDKNTATHNDTITDLVKFARDEGLGRGTQEMFNTYPDGSDNNFKSAQDSITFLDVEDGGSPDPADKLKQNEKLADLASQIRDGFWGETGNDLLTLDGRELKSDASVPNANGTKNSRLPLNMQSIKNAIAATDLPKDQRDRMYEISQANQELYSKVESKEMTYDQYKSIKAESEQEYVSILSNSKSYQKLNTLMEKLDEQGFFEDGGLGSTKSGQTYLWNSLNALLGSKGATPAAQYPKDQESGGGRRGGGRRGNGFGATDKSARGEKGVEWTPVKARRMAQVQRAQYTPANIQVKLGNAVKKDRTQNYSNRSF